MRLNLIRPLSIALVLSTAPDCFEAFGVLAANKPTYASKMELGQLLYFNGNLDQAIRAFKYASELDPKAFDPHMNLVNIYAQKQDYQAAVFECREALKMKPKSKDLHLVLGNLLRTISQSASGDEQKRLMEESVAEIQEAEKLGANKVLVHSTLSVIHVQRGDFDRALEHADRALGVKDELPDLHMIRGVLKYKKGDKEAAMKELDLAIKQKGKNADARNSKADILFSEGKVDEALEEYRRAVVDDEKHAQARVGLSNILVKRERWEEAMQHLSKAQELKPDDANIIYSIGICLEKLGRYSEAASKFNDGLMVDTNPNSKAQIQQHLADLQRANFMRVPGLGVPGIGVPGIGSGASSSSVGSGLFSSPFFDTQFKDMIKIKPPAGSQESSQNQ